MRLVFLMVAAVMCAANASAQPSVAEVARFSEDAATLASDRATFPKQIERGSVIVEMRQPGIATRRFADAHANEHALERLILTGGVFCGAAAISAAAAAAMPADAKVPRTCFRDADSDGAADQTFAVLGELRVGEGFGLAAAAPLSPARPWQAGPSLERRIEYRYGGAVTGSVLPDGRVGEGGVEVHVVSSTTGDTGPRRRTILIGCLNDGRCGPVPASRDPIFALANPTVEGVVEARIVSLPEAIRISGEVDAMVARQRAQALEQAQTQKPAGPAPPAPPVPPPEPSP